MTKKTEQQPNPSQDDNNFSLTPAMKAGVFFVVLVGLFILAGTGVVLFSVFSGPDKGQRTATLISDSAEHTSVPILLPESGEVIDVDARADGLYLTIKSHNKSNYAVYFYKKNAKEPVLLYNFIIH